MRILLLTGGLCLLAAMPVAAQEASDSTRLFAVPATTPAAPNMQELFVGAADAVSGALTGPSTIGIAGAALVGLCLCGVRVAAGRSPLPALTGA